MTDFGLVKLHLTNKCTILYNLFLSICYKNGGLHMARGAGKNNWALFLLVLAGIVIGSFIAQATAGISALSWFCPRSGNFGINVRAQDQNYHRKYSWYFDRNDHLSFYLNVIITMQNS